MSSSDDFAALAERYLDLWRRQAQAIAEDPNAIRAIDECIRFFATAFRSGNGEQGGHGQTQRSAAGAAPGPGAKKRGGTGPDTGAGAGAGAKAGTAPAGGPSVGGQSELSELLQRIASLESRLADLEAGGIDGKPDAGPAPEQRVRRHPAKAPPRRPARTPRPPRKPRKS